MPSKVGLIRAYALPVLWMFALPALALWFAGHATERFDARFFAVVEPELRADASLGSSERAQALAAYREFPPSVVCFDDAPRFAGYRENLGDMCSDLRQFAAIRLLGLCSMGLAGASLLFALTCALASFVSRPLQYLSFVLGWNVLKVAGALQAVVQGTTAVLLSFWMTALWLERYSPKLIVAVGVVAALAVWKLLVAIFKRPPTGLDVDGELIEEAQAPALWGRIRALCGALGTAPPEHLVAGIDDNFFVTEGEVRLGERRLAGRTLYVSLSLLRVLERSEAEAVLAHEMAHFRGGDTAHAKRLSPLLASFAQYLGALHEGLITRPIFHFMLGYYTLLSLSLSKSSREREFAADRAAAELISPADVARALVKVGAYASYRGRVEEELFSSDRRNDEVAIAQRVAQGFSGYAATEAVHFDLHEAVTPHPFDSHPHLSERLEAVAAPLDRDAYGSVLLAPLASSWVEAITPANDIEQRLWSAYEARFAAAHELSLAYRYEPANEDERAHVERFFPALLFAGKEGKAGVELDYAKLTHAAWEAPLSFDEVASLALEKRMFKRYLDLKLKNGGLLGSKRSICLDELATGDELVDAVGRYFGRHQHMKSQKAAEAA